MAAGIVKEINSTNRSYYMVNDITELLGISRSKAYEMIRTMRKECIASGKLTKAYIACQNRDMWSHTKMEDIVCSVRYNTDGKQRPWTCRNRNRCSSVN